MKLKEINDQIGQIIAKNSLFDPTTKKMIQYKTIEPYIDQKLKKELKKQNIKSIDIWYTTIRSTLNCNCDFTKLNEIICQIYNKENYKLNMI